MAHHPGSDQQYARALLEAQILECYDRAVYAHKTHEKRADCLQTCLCRINLVQIILSVLTTGGVAFAFFGYGSYASGFGAVCSTLLLFLNAYTREHNLAEMAEKHRRTAADIWLVRERYRTLITEIRIGNKTLNEMTGQHNHLITELHNVYAGAPSTNEKAYRQAKKALREEGYEPLK